jgi:hypothetical protein
LVVSEGLRDLLFTPELCLAANFGEKNPLGVDGRLLPFTDGLLIESGLLLPLLVVLLVMLANDEARRAMVAMVVEWGWRREGTGE